MSLQGTLDTLSLPELCELLSGTNKTGALHVRAEAGQGVLWFTGGKVCAGEAGGQTGPPPPGVGGDLLERLHDVCFELFRFTEGTFEFEADRRPSWPADRSVEVTGLLAETDRRMAEWREIIAVIPSIEARPRLVPEPPPSAGSGAGETAGAAVTAGAGAAAAAGSDAAPDPTPPAKAARAQSRPEPEVAPDTADAAADADPLADGLDRGAVVALLASARSK